MGDDAFYSNLGRRLKAVRKRANLTQAALAERVGLTRTSIANVETGRQRILTHTLCQIALSLGVEPSELLPPLKDVDREPDIAETLRAQGQDDETIKWAAEAANRAEKDEEGEAHAPQTNRGEGKSTSTTQRRNRSTGSG